MRPNEIVSHEEWLAARKALLAREKETTRALDRLRAERRALPWVRVEKPYTFHTWDGRATLADLFEGRSQLAVYHFMLTPGSDRICDGCAFLSDHVDAARMHFEHADLSFVAVSRAPLAEIERVKQRMGWRFRWVSSEGSDFNYDFGVSFRPEQVARGEVGYNYGTTSYAAEDLHGTSVFAKGEDGSVFHTYSTYARGAELLGGAFNWLDLTPKGRNERTTMDWVRLHDEYDTREAGCSRCDAA
ncbi:MAG TPA: thioredoxin family protein [Acetobacteraceae bacterium]|nr:thioredoxin family protein [Acetobacteraceae bacterium]